MLSVYSSKDYIIDIRLSWYQMSETERSQDGTIIKKKLRRLFMGLFDKVFGSHSDKELKRISKTVDKIEALDESMQKIVRWGTKDIRPLNLKKDLQMERH